MQQPAPDYGSLITLIANLGGIGLAAFFVWKWLEREIERYSKIEQDYSQRLERIMGRLEDQVERNIQAMQVQAEALREVAIAVQQMADVTRILEALEEQRHQQRGGRD